jgi:hypothetical protein
MNPAAYRQLRKWPEDLRYQDAPGESARWIGSKMSCPGDRRASRSDRQRLCARLRASAADVCDLAAFQHIAAPDCKPALREQFPHLAVAAQPIYRRRAAASSCERCGIPLGTPN